MTRREKAKAVYEALVVGGFAHILDGPKVIATKYFDNVELRTVTFNRVPNGHTITHYQLDLNNGIFCNGVISGPPVKTNDGDITLNWGQLVVV